MLDDATVTRLTELYANAHNTNLAPIDQIAHFGALREAAMAHLPALLAELTTLRDQLASAKARVQELEGERDRWKREAMAARNLIGLTETNGEPYWTPGDAESYEYATARDAVNGENNES